MSTTDALPAEPPFLGESRIRLVDGLLAVLAEAEALGEARWVSLEAPSGWGKTRVAQALYARLAARPGAGAIPGADGAGSGRYWPATILEATDATPGDVASRRKRVFPDPARFDRAPGALPGFFWWGIACEQRSCGTASQSLLEDLQQVEAHAVYLDTAWVRLASLAERLTPGRARLGQASGEVRDELIGHVVGMGIEQIASYAIPGGGLVVKLARLGVGKAAETRRHREVLAVAGPLSGDPRPDPVDETLAMLTRLARPGLPVIVFVEDLHRATPLVEELIERLVRSNAALLVITSTWPGELERRDRLMALAAEPIIAPRCLRVRHDRPAPAPFPAGAGLDALAPADLAELVRAYHPNTDPATLARLAARFNNPLPLELICTLPKYRRASAQDGALRLDPADIERLPRRVEDIYRELWDELPEPAQQALALATLAIPDGDAAWHRAIAAQSIDECLELPAHDALAETLGQDRIPHGWVRALTDWLRRFNEPDQLAIAVVARAEHFLEEDLERVRDRLAAVIAAHPLAETDPETQHCARLLLTLHGRGEGDRAGRIADTDALRAVRLLQRAFADQPRELPARVALGRTLAGLLVDADSLDLLYARADYAQALGESGQVEAAEAAYTALLADQERLLGPDHPDTLTTLSDIAYWRAESGEIGAALADFADLLADQERILGHDHPYTLTTRNNIADLRAQSGEIAAALANYAGLLADLGRILGPDHPDTLATRNNIANWWAESGEIVAAMADSAALLADQVRILGPDHPDTLVTRHNIASWRAKSGDITAALADFASLLADQRRILGSDHPNSLRTRNNIAVSRAESGEIAAALVDFVALLADQERILCPDHPGTLRTRNNIAVLRAQSGEIAAALTDFAALLADRGRILGPDHPNTLTTRNNIAYWRAESGEIAAALAELAALLADRGRILGPNHPDTLTTRNNIATWRAESGEIAAALADSAALLADRGRILGPDHPQTLRTRNNIAALRAESGEIAAALADFAALLADRERILGPGHPDTLMTRNNIAAWRAQSGEIAAALADFEALLADQVRVLDPGHPDLQLTRDWIAHLRKRLDTRSPPGTDDYRDRWSRW